MSNRVVFLGKFSLICFSFDSLLRFIAHTIEINW